MRFLHDFLAGVTIHTADDLLLQIQVGWAYALHLHERYEPTSLPQTTGGEIKGSLLCSRAQALVVLGDHSAASEAFASSAIAFLHEHYTMESAGVRLLQAATARLPGTTGQRISTRLWSWCRIVGSSMRLYANSTLARRLGDGRLTAWRGWSSAFRG